MTAFGEAVRLYREGHAEECRTILRSILEIDPAFGPAQRLSSAVASGTLVDLGELIGQVTAASTVRPEDLVERARQAMAARDFKGAEVITQELLRELPGHLEGRALLAEAQERAHAAAAAAGYAERARQAIEVGMFDAARSFVVAAERSDAASPGLPELRQRVQGAAATESAQPEFEFDVFRVDADAGQTAVTSADEGASRAHEAPPEAEAAAAGTSGAPTEAAAGAVGAGGGGQAAEGGGVSGAFEPAAPEFDFSADRGESPARAADSRVAALLGQGQEAFERGDFAAAIDTWSRIYLVDAHHEEATHRIEEARHRREEVERLAEHRFYEARDAFDQGNADDARQLCHEVLQLQPQHLEAHDLLQRLETPSAPPPPPVMPPEVAEEDLFKDDFVPSRISSSGAVPAVAARGTGGGVRASREAARASASGLRRVPLPILGAVGGALVLLLVAGVLLRGSLFGGPDEDVSAGLAEAERLAGDGQFQQAVTLLQSLEVEGEVANQVRQRLLEYQRKLKSSKAPETPGEAALARQALAQGLRVKALGVIRLGLTKVPGDRELQSLASEITVVNPVLPALADAVASRNYESVRQHAATLLSGLPGDPEAGRLWSAATFDRAVTLLRKYQVAEAYGLLQELAAKGGDPEVERLKDLAASYRSRPIDPRYQIFVTSVELRPLE